MPTDKKISQMTDGGQFQPTDQFAVDRAGASFRVQIPNGGLPASNDAFIVVLSTSDPAANGLALLAAYTAAKLLTPSGGALSSTNRAAVIIPPGKYTLVTPLTLAQFVDLISGTDEPSETLVTSAIATASSGTIVQPAGISDVIIRGLTIQNTGSTRSANDPTDAAAWHFYTNLSATQVINCIFDDGAGLSWGMTQGAACNGKYIDCVGGDKTFGGSASGEARGSFIRCTGGDNSFAGDSTVKSTANFEFCVGGDNSFGNAVEAANFQNCTGGTNAFGRSVFIGNAYNCQSGANGFGKGGFAGVAVNCRVTGDQGFGGNGSTCQGLLMNCRCEGAGAFGGVTGTFSGQAYNCFSGNYSFGGNDGVCSGHAVNCTAGEASFGGGGGTFSGRIEGCILATFTNGYPFAFNPWANAFAPATFTGKISNVTFSPSGTDKDAATVPNGATGEFEACTFKKTGTGTPLGLASGSATIKFSYCKFNTVTGVAVGITNALAATIAAAFCIGDTDV